MLAGWLWRPVVRSRAALAVGPQLRAGGQAVIHLVGPALPVRRLLASVN